MPWLSRTICAAALIPINASKLILAFNAPLHRFAFLSRSRALAHRADREKSGFRSGPNIGIYFISDDTPFNKLP